jgi:hypothetical protein
MIKNAIIFSVILLASCSVSKKPIENRFDTDTDLMSLNFLNNYKTTSNALPTGSIVIYESLKLFQEISGDSFKIYLNNKEMLIGTNREYHYLFEVYKDSFLIISYVKGASYAAGPDLFERDSVIILDLKTSILNEVNLENIHLTRSKNFLLKSYSKNNRNDLDIRSAKYCAIDQIDLKHNKIILVDQFSNLITFKTKNKATPFKFQ